eukprot:1157453-Pelagomonas_calceolata.AAC.2
MLPAIQKGYPKAAVPASQPFKGVPQGSSASQPAVKRVASRQQCHSQPAAQKGCLKAAAYKSQAEEGFQTSRVINHGQPDQPKYQAAGLLAIPSPCNPLTSVMPAYNKCLSASRLRLLFFSVLKRTIVDLFVIPSCQSCQNEVDRVNAKMMMDGYASHPLALYSASQHTCQALKLPLLQPRLTMDETLMMRTGLQERVHHRALEP